MQSLCSAFFFARKPNFNRLKANLRDVCGTEDADCLVDDHLADADHGSDLDGRLAGEGHDSGTADGRPVDDRLEGVDHGSEMEDGRLVDDRLEDEGHGSEMEDGHPADDRLAGEDHGFDTAGGHLVDDLPAGVDHDSGTDARLAGLGRVAGLRVSLYRRHRVHTSYGIQPG